MHTKSYNINVACFCNENFTKSLEELKSFFGFNLISKNIDPDDIRLKKFHAILTDLENNKKNSLHNIDDIGFKNQFKIFNKIKKNNLNFIVINADNILINPSKTIKKLCKLLKIRFSKKMLSWPKGKRSSDGIWSKVWYKNVELSNTFSKYRKEKINVPKKYKKIYEESLKYYNEMNQYSI